MEREIDMKEVSDGRLYSANNLVKADCYGCEGCSSCCQGMGASIILDPLDIYQLCKGLNTNFEALMQEHIELNIVDNLILPNLKMSGEQEVCSFLDENGRCSVHSFRPGICRLFPLGRIYENDSFQYFLQVHECPKPNKGKVKIKKWLEIADMKTYEKFICDWHYYLKDLQKQVEADADKIRTISMKLLQTFYLLPYETDRDFYEQFYERFVEK